MLTALAASGHLAYDALCFVSLSSVGGGGGVGRKKFSVGTERAVADPV